MIFLENENGTTAQIEISGSTAIPVPTCQIYGKRGALEVSADGIKLKYIDPEYILPPLKLSEGPGELIEKEVFNWIESEEPPMPKKPVNIWDKIYEDLTGLSEYPVKTQEVIEVMRIIDTVRTSNIH
jgi:predicted dehydrogenase